MKRVYRMPWVYPSPEVKLNQSQSISFFSIAYKILQVKEPVVENKHFFDYFSKTFRDLKSK
jgi:hypothetical protein